MPEGDYSQSSFLGQPLRNFFASDAEAKAWHVEFSSHIGAIELNRNDAMATAPSIAAARTAPLLRRLEAHDARVAGPARYLELVWEMWCCSRGVDLSERPVTAETALAQYDDVVTLMDQWFERCEALGHIPNAQRQRGFITTEQHTYWKLNRSALSFQIELARSNGYLEHLRSALPTSASNESPTHNLMRRQTPAMRVIEVARAASTLLVADSIASDLARTFVVNADAPDSSYANGFDQSHPAREAAILNLPRRSFTLTRDEGKIRREKKSKRSRDAATIRREDARLDDFAKTTKHQLERSRVFRDGAESGKFGMGQAKKTTMLEKRISDPQLWVEQKLKGRSSPFDAAYLLVLSCPPGGKPQATRFNFNLSLGRTIVVRPQKGQFQFVVSTASTGTVFECSYDNIYAACFGKRLGSNSKQPEGVVVVTLLVLGPEGAYNVVSFCMSRKDANVCKALVNQKDGIGHKLLESKFAGRETPSKRTLALVALRRVARDGDDDSGSLAAHFGVGWEKLDCGAFCDLSTGLCRIGDAVTAAGVSPDAAPSWESVRTEAASGLKAAGLFVLRAFSCRKQ
jgi:hypothetical protein